jgi:ubiquinol-cytochrome c reductase iron-sulfur subunit
MSWRAGRFQLIAAAAGDQKIVAWRGRPVFVLRRTADELRMLQKKRDTSLLSDPNSTARQQPPYAKNWHRSMQPGYLVVVGICTHLGCIPRLEAQLGGSFGPN